MGFLCAIGHKVMEMIVSQSENMENEVFRFRHGDKEYNIRVYYEQAYWVIEVQEAESGDGLLRLCTVNKPDVNDPHFRQVIQSLSPIQIEWGE